MEDLRRDDAESTVARVYRGDEKLGKAESVAKTSRAGSLNSYFTSGHQSINLTGS